MMEIPRMEMAVVQNVQLKMDGIVKNIKHMEVDARKLLHRKLKLKLLIQYI